MTSSASELRDTELEFHHLKPVQLAQAILESGRGGSDLFQLHGNPFGMKYRHEMNTIAVPIQYTAHDGVDVYCKFDNLQDAVDGYWQFIDRRFIPAGAPTSPPLRTTSCSSPLRAMWVVMMQRNSGTSARSILRC